MKKWLFTLSLSALWILSQVSTVGAAGIGVVTGLRGEATVRRDPAPQQAQALKFKDDVQWQDTLNTGDDARLRLLILQKSVITMKEQSQLQLREEAVSPTQPKKKSVLNLLSGSIRAVVEKDALKDSDFEVHTNIAVAAIRGSDLISERTGPNEANFFTGPGATATVFHTNPAVGTRELAELTRARVLLTAIDITRITLDEFRSLAGAHGPKGAQARGHRAESTLASVENRVLSQGTIEAFRTVAERGGVGGLSGGRDSSRGPTGDRGPDTRAPIVPPTQNLGTGSETFNIRVAWGAQARDLDSHLTGPSNSRFHVAYFSPGNSDLTVSPNAFLHNDNTGYSGSEVISFQARRNGTYNYSVFNYGSQSTGNTNFQVSQAQAQLIQGGTATYNSTTGQTVVTGGTVRNTFNVPTSGSGGNTWNVFQAQGAGRNLNVTTVNTLINSNGSSTIPGAE